MIGSLPPTSARVFSASRPSTTPSAEPAGDSFVKTAALNTLDVVKYGGLLASTAAAGWLGGGPGILASMAGSALGYGIYACTINEGPSAFKAATAGTLVGAFGGLCGAIAGPEGMIVMGALGAAGCVIGKTTNWFEGWSRDGKYVG